MDTFNFIGTYTHKVDSKNRITVPAEFMKQLGDNRTIIVSQVSVSHKDILAVFPNDEIFAANIGSYLAINKDENDIFYDRYISSLIKRITIDVANRMALKKMITVPDDRILKLVGRRDLFEIWHVDDFEQYLSDGFELHKKL